MNGEDGPVVVCEDDEHGTVMAMTGRQQDAEEIASALNAQDDAAVERAARGLCEYGVLTVDGEVATWERHHRKLTQMAQIALNCAAAREGTTNRKAM